MVRAGSEPLSHQLTEDLGKAGENTEIERINWDKVCKTLGRHFLNETITKWK